jgi:hypothetical protein
MAYCSAVLAVNTNANVNVGAGGPGTGSWDGIAYNDARMISGKTRLLLVNQTTNPSQNGVWIWNGNTNPLSRPPIGDPFATTATLDYATVVPVTGGPNGGLTWGGSEWWLSSPTSGTTKVDTDNLTFIRKNVRPVQARFASIANVALGGPGPIIDGRTVTDGSMVGSSTTLTCATSQPFTSADVGKTIVVAGAGSGGTSLPTTIAGFTSSSVVALAAACNATGVTAAAVQYTGVTPNVGDVVLLVGQTGGNGAADNGLYSWNGSATAMTRTADPVYPNMEVQISEGSTQAHARYRLTSQGTIVLGSGGTALNFARQNSINVRDYGATGNGSTDDTAAINAAIAAFVAAQASSAPGAMTTGTVGTGYTLYFPSGKYIISSKLTIANITGGVICGDGMYSSVIQDSGASAFNGAEGIIVLQNCYQTTMQDLQVSGQGHYTKFATGTGSANVTSISVNSVTGISVGQRIGLMRVSRAVAEMVSVIGISGTGPYTLTIVGAGGGTLYSYSTNDWVVTGPLATVTNLSTYNGTSGMYGHGCRFNRVLFNNSQDVNVLFGFATDCLGGPPTVLASGITGGSANQMTVRDPSQLFAGHVLKIWDSIASAPEPAVTIASGGINLATGVVTITGTFANNHSAGAYVVSQSDANNDEHLFSQCVFSDATVAGIGIQGWNSLNHLFTGCDATDSYATVSMRQGGSFKWVGGDASGNGVDFEVGGGIQRPIQVHNCGSEGSSQMVVAHGALTTIAAGSGGMNLPQSTINVVSTAGFPSAGLVTVATTTGLQSVVYSGRTGTTLTGCTGGSGTMSIGGSVISNTDNTQNLALWCDHYDKKGLPASGSMLDLTSGSLGVSMHACNLAPGAASGYGLNFVDAMAAGLVTMRGGCAIGMSAITLNGVQLVDVDSTWTTTSANGVAPTETSSNGGGVRSFAASYGSRNAAGAVTRRPANSVALATGFNSGNGGSGSTAFSTHGDNYLECTGPGGAYQVTGFSGGNPGQELVATFAINQQLTICHNNQGEAQGNRILCPQGQDIVFSAPGGNFACVTCRFLYSASQASWRLVSWTGTPTLWTPANGSISAVMWLNAGTLSAGAVSSWTDGITGTRAYTQSNSSKQPAYSTALGVPSVLFTQSSPTYLQTAGWALAQPQDIFVVCEPTSVGSARADLFDVEAGNANEVLGYFNNNTNLSLFAGAGIGGTCTAVSSLLTVYRFTLNSPTGGSGSAVYQTTCNGSAIATGNAGTDSKGIGTVGANTAGANGFNGYIMEVVQCGAVLSAYQESQLVNYFNWKYGLACT